MDIVTADKYNEFKKALNVYAEYIHITHLMSPCAYEKAQLKTAMQVIINAPNEVHDLHNDIKHFETVFNIKY